MSNGFVPRQRSFAGPIVLILVGVVLLLAKLDIIGWGSLRDAFARYWPTLLILWGVIKLVEYQQAKSAGVQPAGIGAGGVVLIIFLIMFGVSSKKFVDMRDSGMFNVDDNEWPEFLRGQSFTFDDQIEQSFASASRLQITSGRGNINLNVGDNDRIKVMIRKTVHAANQSDADRYSGRVKPTLTVVDKVATLNANTEGAGDHDVSVDLDIYIPRKVTVAISSRHGEISVMGRDGDLEINSDSGKVSLLDIAGNAKLNIEKSGVSVSKLSGDLTIDGKVKEVSINDVKGTVRLTGEFYEDVSLARIAKAVSFKTSRTDLELSGVAGTLDLDGGDLHASSVAGPLRLLTKEKDIRLDGVNGDVRVSNNDGGVEVRINKLPIGNIDINNRNADVQIYLPEQAGFKLDANTDNGEVESGFSELKVNNGDDRGQASGTVGNGAGSIRVSNAHGGIEIRKGSAAPAVPKPPAPPGSDAADGGEGDGAKAGLREF